MTEFNIVIFADISNFLAIKKQIKWSSVENSLEFWNVSFNTLVAENHWISKIIKDSQAYQRYEAYHVKVKLCKVTSLWEKGGKCYKKR